MSARFLIVDDHQLFAEGLQFVIEGSLPGAVCDLAYSVDSALAILASEVFDLVLVDLNMPGADGLALIRAALVQESSTPVLVLSSVEDKLRIHSAIEAGARGFIPKSLGSEQVIQAITHVLDGGTYVENGQLDHASWINARDVHDQRLQLYGITARQYEVLVQMKQGQSNKEIAKLMGVSPETIKFHVKALLKALNAGNRLECIEKARAGQLLNDSDLIC